MKNALRKILIGAGTTSVASASVMLALAACSSDEQGVVPESDGGTNDANVPSEAASDASAPIDARAPYDAAPEAVVCNTTPCAVELVAGDNHFCARMSDGTVRCWGEDSWGQLGRGEIGETDPDAGDAGAIPPVVDLSNVVQLSASERVNCALLADGSVRCWGANYLGQLGLAVDPPIDDEDRHPTPQRVALEGPVARVDVGTHSVCAVLRTGKLACWGNAQDLKLARPDAGTPGPLPIIVGPGEAQIGTSFAETFASTKTMVALTAKGEVFSWGAISGDDGIVSGRVSSKSPDITPKPLEELANVTDLAVSSIQWREPVFPGGPGRPPPPVPHGHGCAIAGGDILCWGVSYTGALCTGLPDHEQLPKRVPLFSKAWPQQITVGDETTCVRMTDGTIQCCGENTNGALGTGTADGFGAFFAPASAFTSHAVHVVASLGSVCALVQGGTVECWGSNARGELARIPDRIPYPTPQKITF